MWFFFFLGELRFKIRSPLDVCFFFLYTEDLEETEDYYYVSAPCPDPGIPKNGSRIGNNFLSEHSVKFICDRGFELEGDETITCADGQWKGTKPKCKGIKKENNKLRRIKTHANKLFSE